MQISNLHVGPLCIELFQIPEHECLCIVGANASGKSVLAAVLSGELKAPGAEWSGRPQSVMQVSFEAAQARYEEERLKDDTDFIDEQDWGSSGLQILRESGASDSELLELCERFGTQDLLERGCRQFSSGEWRRIELLKAILSKPELLILDEPFEALDADNRRELLRFLEALLQQGQKLLLMVNRLADVPAFCAQLALLQAGKFTVAGPRSELLNSPAFAQLFSFDSARLVQLPEVASQEIPDPLVDARALTVVYEGLVQFAPFDWSLRPGQHTRIIGPNGCGKSTLLQLLTGDHAQCYGNDLCVVGYRRGSGESIWDVKKRIGLVSPALHRDYRVAANAREVVISGLFDSIGLYQKVSPQQSTMAEAWLDIFDLRSQAARPFRELSYGQQRLVLIARALIKQPPLLILDEPTQGLDDLNRKLVLAYVERLLELKRSTLLFVSHHEEEQLTGIERELRFVPCEDQGVKFKVELALKKAG